MTDRPKFSVLFLCTGNSCRSQMAEAMLRQLAGDRFEAISAGTHPAGFLHPLVIDAMRQLKIPLTDQTSKSWDEFKDAAVDAVITVCDAAAGQACPVRPGHPLTAHWSLPDPVYHPGTDKERLAFTLLIAERLRTKIQGLAALDWSGDRAELKRRLDFLGEI